MSKNDELTPKKHKKIVEDYIKERPHFVVYAKVLRRVLEEACGAAFPEALVQSRAKEVSSFSEKVVRKYDKYKDPVRQFNDLCGARVIVQTTEQVSAVCRFVEANFDLIGKENKELLLGQDRFGYRDIHYIVRLDPDSALRIGIEPDEMSEIGQRKAEIQVRTWVQHAWADTLHDRIYKNKLKLSAGVIRAGNLLAALMEEGDRNFNRLADEIDELIANYTAYTSKAEVEKEIRVLQLIVDNEPDEKKQAALALRLARLLAACGEYGRVVKLLTPHTGSPNGGRHELMLELGYSLCQLHRGKPGSEQYRRGLGFLEQSLKLCEGTEITCVPHLRRDESLHARALARLGWAWEAVKGQELRVREYYRRAYEREPFNPYYLAAMMGFELHCLQPDDIKAAMRTTLRQAVKTCREHALAEIELPYAYFTAGRLNVLLDQPIESLHDYARGIQYCLAGIYCAPKEVFDAEIQWLKRLHYGSEIPQDHQQVIEMLDIADGLLKGKGAASSGTSLKAPVLIVAGGAASMEKSRLQKVQGYLLESLKGFQGTVISGGTSCGVPGCVGQVADKLKTQGLRQFSLIGYVPELLPGNAPLDGRYDVHRQAGKAAFSPAQVLQNWRDILAAGIRPADVTLLGFGGGPISSVEYRLALALGATVGLVRGMGGTSEELLGDPLWTGLRNLLPLPNDVMTVRAFCFRNGIGFRSMRLEEMAKNFHARYRTQNTKGLPENLKPWDELSETYRKANLEQARCSVQILQAAGFNVRESKRPVPYDFSSEDIEFMAELEHGRWNIERLRDGWRCGKRDDGKKYHDCLIPWKDLPTEKRRYDLEAVGAFPEILAKAGLEIYRRPDKKGRKAVRGKTAKQQTAN